MCHENKMGAAKNSTHIEQYKLSKDSGTAVEQGTVTRPLFILIQKRCIITFLLSLIF